MLKYILASTALVVAGGAAQAASLQFTSILNSQQTVNESNSAATGTGTVSVDGVAQTIGFSLSITGISIDQLADAFVDGANAALGPIHIHDGVTGANGPVAIPFVFGTSYSATAAGFDVSVDSLSYADATGISGFAESFDDFVEGLANAEYYINIHTDAVPGGEIRGQVLAADVAPVPLPASALLLIAGLGGLGMARRARG